MPQATSSNDTPYDYILELGGDPPDNDPPV